MTFTETRDEKLARLQKMAQEAAEYSQMKLNAARYEWMRDKASVDHLRSVIDLRGVAFDSYIDAASAKVPA